MSHRRIFTRIYPFSFGKDVQLFDAAKTFTSALFPINQYWISPILSIIRFVKSAEEKERASRGDSDPI